MQPRCSAHRVEGVRHAEAQEAEHARVKQAAKLPEAVQRQHHHRRQEGAKQLCKDVDERGVPVAVEHECGAEHSGRVEGGSRVGSACSMSHAPPHQSLAQSGSCREQANKSALEA